MVATPMTELEDENPSEHPKPEFPIPRPGDAREIAACISWLCSSDARWTTGASIRVDGGYMLATPSARPDEAD
jgi:NAD(P)-dependent dehydrogenase (short-subunit alcohol dehydrogenase family)